MKQTNLKKARKVGNAQLQVMLETEKKMNRTLVGHILTLVYDPNSSQAQEIVKYYKQKMDNATDRPDPAAVN